MKTIIRARRQDEIDTCVVLLADVHAADGYPLHWPADPRGWLTPPMLLTAWVAEDEGALVGHVALHRAVGDAATPMWSAAAGLPAEQLVIVAQLFVSPQVRGRALGATLLATACAEASSRGLRPALDVLDHDRAAMALYERAGWQRVASAPAPWAVVEHGERAVLHYYLAPG
jgi:GNAT superfamily N-acetyltransferase